MKLSARLFGMAVSLLFVLSALPYARASGDWLPIPSEDLALKDNPQQPGANAMVLYRQVDIDERSSGIANYVRIKIFTQAGVAEQANVELEYDKSEESIQAVRGRTIQPDGSITEFDGKTFDKEIVKGAGVRYLAKVFTMPNVQPGSIIEFKFRDQFHQGGGIIGSWTVQYDLFTRLARFSLTSPPSPTPLLSRPYHLYVNDVTVLRPTKDSYALEVRDLPGIENEPLMPPPISLRAAVEFYYAPMNETPAQFWKRIGKAWNDEAERFLYNKGELDAEVRQDVNNDDPPEIKLRKLYARALKIRNLDLESNKSQKEEKEEQIKSNNTAGDLLRRGYGNTLEIDFLMIGLARAAGFESAAIVVASRNGRIFDAQRNAASDLRSPLVWVRLDSKDYYLDPGAGYFPFGVLPWDKCAADGIRLTKDGGDMVKTPAPAAANASTARHADLHIDASMGTAGKLQVDFGVLESAYMRLDQRDADPAGRKKFLEDEIAGWLPAASTFEVSSVDDWDDLEKPVRVEGTLTIPLFAKGIQQRILVPIEIFQPSEAASFQSQKRVNEIVFPYPYERTDDIVIHAPAGFTVQSIHDPQELSPDSLSYEIWVTKLPDGVEVKRRLVVSGMRFPKEAYHQLRDFFGDAKTDDNAVVVLQAQSAKNN
jgi:hypothetical protein